MNCPFHDPPVELVKEIYEADVEIDKCPKCRGIWLDPGELETIQQTQEIDYSNLLDRGENKEAIEYNRERQLSDTVISCPACTAAMDILEHNHNSRIVIDYCSSCHGIWLDEGELQALEIYYERELKKHPKMTRLQLLLAGFKRIFGLN